MAAPGVRTLNLKCSLRYQHCTWGRNDLKRLSNGPYGTTVAVFAEDPGPNMQSYLRMIGTLDKRDAERLNHVARPQLAGAFRPRGGPRIGSRFCPDVVSATVSNFSPQYNNANPPNYGFCLPVQGGTIGHMLCYELLVAFKFSE